MVRIINDKVYKRQVLHTFTIDNCADPELYAADPIYQWQKTLVGEFCLQNAVDLEFHTQADYDTMGYRIAITGYVTEKHATFLALKKS